MRNSPRSFVWTTPHWIISGPITGSARRSLIANTVISGSGSPRPSRNPPATTPPRSRATRSDGDRLSGTELQRRGRERVEGRRKTRLLDIDSVTSVRELLNTNPPSASVTVPLPSSPSVAPASASTILTSVTRAPPTGVCDAASMTFPGNASSNHSHRGKPRRGSETTALSRRGRVFYVESVQSRCEPRSTDFQGTSDSSA